MATLKVKKVKGHEYFYWSKSVRSHKRFGGDGRVKTVDCLVGSTPVGQWLAYYFWSGEVELRQYAQAVLKHLCPAAWEAVVEVSIDWRKYKVSTKSKHPWFADCRSRRWREQRKALQSWLDRIIEDSTQLDRFIQQAGYLLGEHYSCSKAVEELRQKAREARLYPDNFAPNAEQLLDECAHANQRRADRAMEYHLQIVEELEKFAPPSKRLQFRHQVTSKTAKLAENRRWLEEYQAKLEQA
jgi:hypothetical protein